MHSMKYARHIRTTVLALVLLAAAPGVSAQEVFREDNSVFATRMLSDKLDMGKSRRMVIRAAETLHGSLVIETGEGNEIELRYQKKARTTSRSRAIDIVDVVAVNLEPITDGAKLDMRAPNPAQWDAEETALVSVTLKVPPECRIELEALYFDVEAVGPLAALIAPSSLGSFEVTDVSEALEIHTRNQRVTITKIRGTVRVSTNNSSLIAQDIVLGEERGEFRNSSGDIRLQDVKGRIDVRNSYGRIDVEEFDLADGKNYVRGEYGPIFLSLTSLNRGQLVVSNRNEDIEVTVPADLSATLSLAVDDDGRIKVAQLRTMVELVQQNRLSLVVGDGDALINGSVRGSGNLFVRGRDVEEW